MIGPWQWLALPILEPVTPTRHLKAFTGYGIEMEYMIVDRDSLTVRPLCDRLIEAVEGEVVNETDQGRLAWSNELVLHVIELKTNGPAPSLDGLSEAFSHDIQRINQLLVAESAMLMPTAMHPLFDPERETRLWPHGQNEIYAAYNRIFDCRGHGWSNLQSTHINLPFADDEEFVRLHAAIRIVLPLIPALAAASPIIAGRATGWHDSRLDCYRRNQQRIPEIAGQIVPEPVHSITDYHRRILEPMYRAIAPHDPDEILADDWLNSRGAIARFERQTIEIRIVDIQECPAADIAIASAIVGLVRALYDETLAPLAAQQAIATEELAAGLMATARHGAGARMDCPELARLLGVPLANRAGDWWAHLGDRVGLAPGCPVGLFERLLQRGDLAAAILDRLGVEPTRPAIVECYRELAECLSSNRLFLP